MRFADLKLRPRSGRLKAAQHVERWEYSMAGLKKEPVKTGDWKWQDATLEISAVHLADFVLIASITQAR